MRTIRYKTSLIMISLAAFGFISIVAGPTSTGFEGEKTAIARLQINKLTATVTPITDMLCGKSMSLLIYPPTGSNSRKFQVDYSTNPQMTDVKTVTVTSSSPEYTQYSLKGLNPNTTYYFKVKSIDVAQNAYSNRTQNSTNSYTTC